MSPESLFPTARPNPTTPSWLIAASPPSFSLELVPHSTQEPPRAGRTTPFTDLSMSCPEELQRQECIQHPSPSQPLPGMMRCGSFDGQTTRKSERAPSVILSTLITQVMHAR